MSTRSKTIQRIIRLTLSALMIALSTILSMLKLFQVPQGGSVTILSMVPLVIIALMYGPRWGTFTCFAHGLLQLLLGLSNLRGLDLVTLLGSVFLDYIFAFAVIGLAGITWKMKNRAAAAGIGAAIGVFLRFVCHFLSGWLLWSEVVADWSSIVYSITYNGSYMLPELIFTVIASAIIWPIVGVFGKKTAEGKAE